MATSYHDYIDRYRLPVLWSEPCSAASNIIWEGVLCWKVGHSSESAPECCRRPDARRVAPEHASSSGEDHSHDDDDNALHAGSSHVRRRYKR